MAQKNAPFDMLEVLKDAKAHLYSKGCMLRSPDDADDVFHVPTSLLPTPFPKHYYHYALSLQPHLNLLYHYVAADKAFLFECLKNVIEEDDFIRNVWDIYNATSDQRGFSNKLVLAINRSDYMLNEESFGDAGDVRRHADQLEHLNKLPADFHGFENEDQSVRENFDRLSTKEDVLCDLKQVEFNTIACGGASSVNLLANMHRHLARKYPGLKLNPDQIPEFDGGEVVAECLIEAWRLYKNPKAIIVMLANIEDPGVMDMIRLENDLARLEQGIIMRRKSFESLKTQARLQQDGTLMVNGEEVAIVYLRWGYSPKHYNSSADWQTRMMIERSRAIVCPNAGHQLAGCKKVQQVLTMPGVLEKYLVNKKMREQVKGCFAGVFSLDLNKEGDKNSELAQERPDGFVMKPQREGGGNNIYGKQIKTVLSELKEKSERAKYILMERLKPRPSPGYRIQKGHCVTQVNLLSEIGIYGGLIGKRDEVLWNRSGGALVRCKEVGCDEGGFLNGIALANSLYLLE